MFPLDGQVCGDFFVDAVLEVGREAGPVGLDVDEHGVWFGDVEVVVYFGSEFFDKYRSVFPTRIVSIIHPTFQ